MKISKHSFLLLAFFFCISLFLGSNVFVFANAVGAVEAKFCNEGKKTEELSVITEAGKKNMVCVEFTNTSVSDLYIDIGFVNAEITNDSIRNKACSSTVGQTNFSDFVDMTGGMLKIPGNATVKKEFVVSYPVGFEGFSYGCLVYALNNYMDSIMLPEGMFDVLVRKAKFMSFYVGDVPIDSNIILNANTPSLDTSGNLFVEFTLDNKGNVAQTINFSGKVSNILGYSVDFSLPEIILQANEKRTFSTKDISIVLPSYKGLLTLDLQIAHIPYFSFDVRHPEMKITKAGLIEKRFFLWFWSWQIVVGMFGIFILMAGLVFFLIKKKSRVINP